MNTNITSIPITLNDITRPDAYYYCGAILFAGEKVHLDFYPQDCHATIYLNTSLDSMRRVMQELHISDKTRRKYLSAYSHTIIVAAPVINTVDADDLAHLYDELLGLPLPRRSALLKTYLYFSYWCGFYGDQPFHCSVAQLSKDLGINLNGAVEYTNWLVNHDFVRRVGTYCFGNERTVSYRYMLIKGK